MEGPVGNCYKFVNDPQVPWNTAYGLCADMGGTLANFESWIEIYWMRGYRASHDNIKAQFYWLGGYKTDRGWEWKGEITSSPMIITNWAFGEPNGASGDEDCLMSHGWNPNDAYSYRWNDDKCRNKRPYICERNRL